METSTTVIKREISLFWENLHEQNRKSVPSTNQHNFELTKQCIQDRLETKIEELLLDTVDNEGSKLAKDLASFECFFENFLTKNESFIDWNKIKKVPSDSICGHASLESPTEDSVRQLLQRLVVVKLNGGLATSMGCKGSKSATPVRGGLTFLDLAVQQVDHLNKTYQVNVPLILMNSFKTNDDTERILSKYEGSRVRILTFEQSCYPRLYKDTLLPLANNTNVQANLEDWYPPGHGDFYESFKSSGFLEHFIRLGFEYCFVSNIDNLGATVDLKILNILANSRGSQPEFLMEITDKTVADVKGGTLIEYEDTLRLLEVAQVPKDHLNDFKSVQSFKYFNTNNLWIKLHAIERVLSDSSLKMEIIANPKTLGDGVEVIQLETAVGAAMKCFQKSLGVLVPRSRFLPVKRTSDLLLVTSDIYDIQDGSLVMSPRRNFQDTPSVFLGTFFSKMPEFHRRFASTPGIVDLHHLTVSGDVTFGKGVTLKGSVIIVAAKGESIAIPAGSVLEDQVITGNLTILDH